MKQVFVSYTYRFRGDIAFGNSLLDYPNHILQNNEVFLDFLSNSISDEMGSDVAILNFKIMDI